MTRTLLVALGGALLLACGGKTDGTDGASDGGGGHDGSSSGSDSAAGSDSPIIIVTDGGSNFDSSPAIVCQQGPGSGSGGGSSCEISVSETCSDGVTYEADCSCPGGTCSCSQMSVMSGSGGSGIPFGGCPTCPGPGAAFKACGFPQ